MQMSSHVPSAMIRQRNSGMFSRVAVTGSHQQTRPAMAAKCGELVSSICTLLGPCFNPSNLAKQTIECEPLARPKKGRGTCAGDRVVSVKQRLENFQRQQEPPARRIAVHCSKRRAKLRRNRSTQTVSLG